MTDEEMMFATWFEVQRRLDWEKDPGEAFHAEWGTGAKNDMRKAWMARAELHVSYVRGAGQTSGKQE